MSADRLQQIHDDVWGLEQACIAFEVHLLNYQIQAFPKRRFDDLGSGESRSDCVGVLTGLSGV